MTKINKVIAFLLLLTAICSLVQPTMALFEPLWSYMAFFGLAWPSLVLYGIVWSCMSVYGILWYYMPFYCLYGFLWSLMTNVVEYRGHRSKLIWTCF